MKLRKKPQLSPPSSCPVLDEDDFLRTTFQSLSLPQKFGRMGSLPGLPLLWPRRRRAKLSSWTMVLVLLLVLLLTIVSGTEDWTLQCPSGCKCTWVSGKKWADCKSSHWSTIPPGLSPEVQVLDMGGNSIKSLPKDAFKSVGLVNLQKVFLPNCRIDRVDKDAFRDLSIMIELDLSENLISSLDMETFESNVRLRELKLARNPLSKLTGLSFPPLMYLRVLDLSGCTLSTLPKRAFEKLTVLETLNLSGNKFSYLSKELLKPLVKLKSLLLSENPWKCDCRLKTFRDWVMDRNLFQHMTKCFEPGHVANFPWDQLISHDFACRPEIVSVQINGKPTDALLVHTDLGSDITLQCLVRGNPPPELKWVRDGTVLTNMSRSYGKSYYLNLGEESWGEEELGDASSDYRGRWVNLTIPRTDPEDAGEYTCVGSNAGGVVEKNLTLNFQDVPSGAGVGHGLGGLGGGVYRDTGWIWILITTVSVLVFATSLVTLICFCSRRRRRVKTGGGGSGGRGGQGDGIKDDHQTQQHLLMTSRTDSSPVKLDEEGATTMLLMKEGCYLVGPDSRPEDNFYAKVDEEERPSSAGLMKPPPPPPASLTGGVHTHHPDLLDHTNPPPTPQYSVLDSPAPSMDSTRMLLGTPGPTILVNPSRLYGRASPFILPFSPGEAAVLPGGGRPGYVTLPRRHRVPSWSPAPNVGGPPSPTGSAATVSIPFVRREGRLVKYDNLGPRTTADGSSRLSLNSSDFGAVNPILMTGTLGRHGVLRSTIAPIQEVEPFKPEEENVGSPSKRMKTDDDENVPSVKKVPPKPPPKPVKKKEVIQNGPPPPPPEEETKVSGGVILGDDGTEV